MLTPPPDWRAFVWTAVTVFVLAMGIVFFAWLTNNGMIPTP